MSIVGMRKFMQGKMQYVMLALAVVMAVGIVGIGIGSGRGRSVQDDSSGVLAKINGEKIERQDFETQYQNQTQQNQGNLPSAFEEAQARGRLFDSIVDQMIRVQAAEKAGVKVGRGEVKKKINEYINMRISQLKEQALANRKGKKTDEAFEAELKRSGTSLAQIKTDLRKAIDPKMVQEQLMIQKQMDKIKEGIDTSDRAVKASFDEIQLAQITVSSKTRPMAQAEQRAKDVLAKARSGESFAKLAGQFSEDAYSASGGDQGAFVRRSNLPRDLASTLFGLKADEVAGPIKQADGYVIYQVKDRRNALPADFNDPKKRKEYRDTYVQQEQAIVQAKAESDMRQNAGIVVNDPEIKGYLITKNIGSYLGPDGGVRAKAKAKEAIKEFEKAINQSSGSSQALGRCYSQISYLYYVMCKTGLLSPTPQEKIDFRKKGIDSVNQALKYTESNDLRTLLADLYIDDKNYDAALKELKYVSDNEFYDYNVHMQILSKYEQMKSARPEIVAQRIADEQKWIADYEQRMKESQAAQEAQQGQVTQQTTKPFKVNPGGG